MSIWTFNAYAFKPCKNFYFLPGLTQWCCNTDHPKNGDNIQIVCTLYPSHENDSAHVIWHVLRAMISLLKNVIRNMETESTIIPSGSCLPQSLNSWAWGQEVKQVLLLISATFLSFCSVCSNSAYLFNFKLSFCSSTIFFRNLR